MPFIKRHSSGKRFGDKRPSYGDRGFGKKRGFGDRGGSFDGPKLFDAVCAECGTDTEVPFKPNGSKPVLCRACFRKDEGGFRDGADRRPAARPKYGSDRSYDRAPRAAAPDRRFDELNDKLDRIIRDIEALKRDRI